MVDVIAGVGWSERLQTTDSNAIDYMGQVERREDMHERNGAQKTVRSDEAWTSCSTSATMTRYRHWWLGGFPKFGWQLMGTLA
jgi:hypothetical protein